jgi:hypothetical protein
MLKRLFMLAAMLIACAAASAAPAHIEAHLTHARLAGQGPFTWFGLKIYDAELWVGEQGYAPGAPFVLELRYARKLDGIKIAEASFDQMEKAGAGTPAQRAAWLARMKEIFPDVREGSRIGGVFLPAGGARFYLDGRPLASVPDPQFARAFFAIWLDPGTTARKLRTALLKDAAPR